MLEAYHLVIALLGVFLILLFLLLGVWHVVAKIKKMEIHSAWFKRLNILFAMCITIFVINFVFESSIEDLVINIFGFGGGSYCPTC